MYYSLQHNIDYIVLYMYTNLHTKEGITHIYMSTVSIISTQALTTSVFHPVLIALFD